LSQLKQNFAKVKLGGGEKRIQNYIAKEKWLRGTHWLFIRS
jgi:hypothetical protein